MIGIERDMGRRLQLDLSPSHGSRKTRAREPGMEGGELFSSSAVSLGRVATGQVRQGHRPHGISEPEFRRRLSWRAARSVRQVLRFLSHGPVLAAKGPPQLR